MRLGALSLAAALGCGSDGLAVSPDGGLANSVDTAVAPGAMWVWGTRLACACDAGAAGESRCLSNGSYGPCLCAAVRADAASTSADSAALADASSPDVLPNFELTRPLSIIGRQLLADGTRGRLYVTVGGTAAANANSLVVIDPKGPTVLSSVAVGSEPGIMAMSDDGSTLWVGIDGAFAIRRIDLRTDPPTPGAMYTLPRSSPSRDPIVVASMVVLPGAPGSVMLAASRGSFGEGLLLIDEGTPRGMPAPAYYEAPRLTLGPAGVVFANGYNFVVAKISPTGFTATLHQGLLSSSEEPLYAAGRVYGRSGVVLDVSNLDKPARVGQFGYTGMLVSSAKPNRMIMLSPTDGFTRTELLLRILDSDRFVQTVAIPVKGATERRLLGLVAVGNDSLAFLAAPDSSSTPGANQTQVHVVTSSVIRDLP